MSLYDALSQIAEQVQRQRHLIDNEEDTILVSVLPFIRALGYDIENLAEVKSQYNADAKSSGGEKVDLAIMRDGKPIIFIEAKGANLTLNETHWKQLHHYFNAEDVRIGILTNGIEYRIYTDLKKRNIMDKEPFLTIDMSKLDERLVDNLKWFTKSSFDRERIIAAAQQQVMARLLQQEMENPSDDLVRHFARQMQQQRLTSSEFRQFGTVLKDAWRDLVKEESPQHSGTNSGQAESSPLEASRTATNRAVERVVSLSSGISKRVPVYKVFKGVRLDAVLIVESEMAYRAKCVEIDGQVMTPSGASKVVKQSVNPQALAENGYKFWRFDHPETGAETKIAELFEDEDLRNLILSAPDA